MNLRRWLLTGVAGVAGLCALVYAIDELSFHLNIPARTRYSTIHIERYKVVNEKFNLASWDRLDPVEERCANALLPHSGVRPCWYVSRHTVQVIPVG